MHYKVLNDGENLWHRTCCAQMNMETHIFSVSLCVYSACMVVQHFLLYTLITHHTMIYMYFIKPQKNVWESLSINKWKCLTTLTGYTALAQSAQCPKAIGEHSNNFVPLVSRPHSREVSSPNNYDVWEGYSRCLLWRCKACQDVIVIRTSRYKKEDMVWLPIRQLSTRVQNDTVIINYRSPYGLQQWAKSIPHSQL